MKKVANELEKEAAHKEANAKMAQTFVTLVSSFASLAIFLLVRAVHYKRGTVRQQKLRNAVPPDQCCAADVA
jgi:hypothetical protein